MDTLKKVIVQYSEANTEPKSKPKKTFLIVNGKKMECQGYYDYFGEYDCGYNTDIFCEDCVFVVGVESGDMRLGKRPFSK